MGWWELLSGFEGEFSTEGWEPDNDGWGFDRSTEQYKSGIYSAKSHTDEQGGLVHALNCTPTEFYCFQLFFKIVGTVPSATSGAILVRFALNDWSAEVDLYLNCKSGSPNPYLRLNYLSNWANGTTSISLEEWHQLRVFQYILSGTAVTEVYLDNMETPEVQFTNNLATKNLTDIEVQPVAWTGASNGIVYIDNIIGACDVDIGSHSDPFEPTITTTIPNSIITRVKSINIGKAENDNYEWFGIHSVSWADVSPWVHINIPPSGPMVHQHILSPHIAGEIRCKDLATLYAAIFTTAIDVNNHTPIHPQTSRKYTVDYFCINMINELKEIMQVFIDGFKVETVGVENIELGLEAVWIVRFTADRVVIGSL